MLSDKQYIEILNRIKKEIENISSCSSIKELSELTNIPRSTIQRDLNNREIILSIADEETYEKIKIWLDSSKKRGLSEGGKNSQANHGYSKDEKGHFKGSK